MEILWIAIGAAAAWFYFIFRAKKATLKKVADEEFCLLITALGNFIDNRDDYFTSVFALEQYAVYAQRQGDAAYLPSGRGIPPERAVMASHWFAAMADANFTDRAGRPITSNPTSAKFWLALFELSKLSDLRRGADCLPQSGDGIRGT
jgi:hypothetical protein